VARVLDRRSRRGSTGGAAARTGGAGGSTGGVGGSTGGAGGGGGMVDMGTWAPCTEEPDMMPPA
jgi:hypothetical protein